MSNNTITGKVITTVHAGTSYYGNPAYWVTVETEAGDTVTLRTQDNSGLSYGITNPEYREEAHTFTLTRANRIRTVTKAA